MESDTQLLAKELNRLGLTSADMSGPYAWVVKALNPSTDEGGVIDGIPDHEAQDSLKMHWRQVSDIDSGGIIFASGDTWEIDGLLFEGPAVLGAYQIRKTGSPTVYENHFILNENYKFWDNADPKGPHEEPASSPDTGNITVEGQSQFQTDFVQYRPLYAGYTMHFDAAALTNQGRVVASQVPNAWSARGVGFAAVALPGALGHSEISTKQLSAGQMTWGNSDVIGPSAVGQSAIVPTYSNTLQSSTTSGTWTSKDGFYLPLRYQDPTMKYSSTMDASPASTFQVVHPWSGLGTPFSIPATLPGSIEYFPYPMSRNMRCGAFCIRGIAPTSTLSLHSRIGYELTVPPGTGYSALLTKTAEPSNAAVERYFVLRRQLADVYPAKYNDSELLQKIINGIGTTVGDILPEGKWKKLVSVLTPIASSTVGAMMGSSKKGGKGSRGKAVETVDDLEATYDKASSLMPGVKFGSRRSAAGNSSGGGKRSGRKGGPVRRGAKAVGNVTRRVGSAIAGK